MAQGNLHLSKKKTARVTKQQKNPRAAAPKIIKPKKNAKEIQVFKLQQQHQAKLHASTEKLISGRVGHLELLRGTRRQNEKSKKK